MLSPLIQIVLKEYELRLKARFGPRLRRVALFGSWARGQATESSDVDVAVVVDGLTTTEWKAIQSDAAEVGVANELPLSVLAMSSARFEELRGRPGIAAEIERDGISP